MTKNERIEKLEADVRVLKTHIERLEEYLMQQLAKPADPKPTQEQLDKIEERIRERTRRTIGLSRLFNFNPY